MKVSIGPYNGDLVPVRRWEQRYELMRNEQTGNYFFKEKDYKWYDKVVFGFFDKLYTLFSPINRWSNKRKRKVKIKVDYFDVWSADHTIALLVHPLLLKLKEVNQGSCPVDPEDVPEEFRPTEEAGPDNGYVDNTVQERWNWVLGEMIWAFEQCTHPDNNDSQFYHNSSQLQLKFVPTGDENLDSKDMKALEFDYQKDPSQPKYWVDREGKEAHYERIKNGLALFAKYYFGLWD